MAVHHGLPARFAHGKPDVVAVRPEHFPDYIFAFTDEINGCPPLIIRHRKEIRRVPERDYEQVVLTGIMIQYHAAAVKEPGERREEKEILTPTRKKNLDETRYKYHRALLSS
jgi:hypothetical protein